MIPRTIHAAPILKSNLNSRSAQTFKAFYATIRDLRQARAELEVSDGEPPDDDFIMSILRANPSLRDTRSYLANFGLKPRLIPRETRPERSLQTEEQIPLATKTRPRTLLPNPKIRSLLPS
ncbi:hypothetical protein QCA50_001969 [Cerrena zonata]|uniref:Uncharacterized protein n=1 Tax=Cerrena zonata TaxID=2478898 RepID=A0AAW0GPZ3_9APHY